MPVNTPCSEYAKNAPIWQKIRDVYAGEKVLKLRGTAERYLVKPDGFQKEPRLWDLYLSLAEFYPATRRTVVGLKGAIFRRAPTIDLKSFNEWAKSVTQDGQSMTTFSKVVVEDVIELGRYGILVDFPVREEGRNNAKAMPYLCGYCTEAIINWKTSVTENYETGEKKIALTMVVLKENVSKPDSMDEFIDQVMCQYRVLDLKDGKYRQRIFKETKDKDSKLAILQDGGDIYPQGSNGEGLNFIPFIFVGATNLTPDVDTSPIEDLVDVNLSHFKTSADLEWGAHLTAMPTPWVTGWDSKGKRLGIGSGIAWTFADQYVKVGMNEYKGEGLGSLERRLTSKEDKMSKLGAMILKTKLKQPETAETTKIEHSGEASVLSLIAGNVSEALTTVAKWAELWKTGKEGTGKVELNTEFYDQRLSPEELGKLVEAHQKGEISTEIYVYNLARGDMLPKDMTQEEAVRQIDESLENPRLNPIAKPIPLPGAGADKPTKTKVPDNNNQNAPPKAANNGA